MFKAGRGGKTRHVFVITYLIVRHTSVAVVLGALAKQRGERRDTLGGVTEGKDIVSVLLYVHRNHQAC